MRISFVEVAGFRGFKDTVRFEVPRGFAVLTGRNGVGKSTVLDAVDFALTGTISKFSVKEAKGGGLEEHIWWVGSGSAESQHVSVGILAENGDEYVIRRSRNGGLETQLDAMAKRLCHSTLPSASWADILIQTTLIRDETIAALSLDLPEQARFAALRAALGSLMGPDHTKRTGAIVSAAATAKSIQMKRLEEAKAELGRALSSLTEARSIAERQADVAEAQRIIARLAPDLVEATSERVEKLRLRVVDMKQRSNDLAAAVAKLLPLEVERASQGSEAASAVFELARADVDAKREARERAAADLRVAEEREAAATQQDSYTSHLSAILEHGEALGLLQGHCPLCDAARTSEEFFGWINTARGRLMEKGIEAARLRSARDEARETVKSLDGGLAAASGALLQVASRRAGVEQEIARVAAMLAKRGIVLESLRSDAVEEIMFRGLEETALLERAVLILETSTAHDRVMTLEGRVNHLRTQLVEESARLSAAERAVDVARLVDSAAKELPNQVLTEQFDTVMPLLKELFERLRPHADWREIEVDFGGRIRASLNFTVGDGHNPQFLFSSGQRRAAGLAFLLAIHLSRPWCRLETLLLDDPVQHVDDYRALNLVEVLSAVRRSGRQLIIAVEDSALADLLCRRLRSTATEPGRRFELATAANGSSVIKEESDIYPLPRAILEASSF